jgi:parallel beta-helix repeat protein
LERTVKLLSEGVLVLLLLSVAGVVCQGEESNVRAAGQHEPIAIHGDSGFTSENGVVSGDGTEANPFAIEGWEIEAPTGNGIEVMGTSASFVIRNVVVNASTTGIFLDGALNAVIDSNVVRSDEFAIMVLRSPGCLIVGNQVSAAYGGIGAGLADGYAIRSNAASIYDEGSSIAIGYSNWSLVEENYVPGDLGNGIYVAQCANATVRSNTVGPSGCIVENSADCRFWDNQFDLSGFGVSGVSGEQLGTLEIPTNNTANGKPIQYIKNLVGAQVDRIEAGQVLIVNCSDTVVSNITVQNVTNGWEPWYTAGLECLWNDNLTFDNLTLANNANDAILNHCVDTVVEFSNISLAYSGLEVTDSPGTQIARCIFWKSGVSLYQSPTSSIRDSAAPRSSVSVDQSDDCVVTGVHQTWADGHGFILSECDNVTVSNCSMAFNGVTYYSGYGLQMWSMTNSAIMNNSVHDNERGIEMNSCTGLMLEGNEVRGNHQNGIDVRYCTNCLIDHNQVIGNDVAGIDLADGSDNLVVTRNILEGNNYGIYFQYLTNSAVHHNDFAGNMLNAYTHVVVPSNSWDDGYPSGGNYWSDYTGADAYNGPAQDQPGPDGIGDVPYTVRGGGYVDRYPFMSPLQSTLNTAPVGLFTVSPSSGNISTEFVFNASSSYDAEDPSSELEVRWDFGYDGNWDVDWSTEKVAKWKFSSPGDNFVRMEVRDTRMFQNDTISVVYLTDEPPTASFTVAPAIGNSNTSFLFSASSSTDLENGSANLEARWDWNNDGVWDSLWSLSKTTTHSFPADGTYTIALEVRDSAGLSNSTTRQIVVESVSPIADAGPDQSVEIGVPVILNGSGSSDNTGLATFTWSCEIDGKLKEVVGMSSNWTFSDAGVYEVVLTVEDVAGNSDSDTVVITVKSPTTGGGTLGDAWWILVVLAIVIVAGVALLLLRRKK